MNNNRIQMLRQGIQENPEDPFYMYALALEYKGEDEEKCLELMKELRKKFPEYLPLYYQLAECLSDLFQKQEALEIYDAGIELAQKQSEFKTLAELKNARQNLLFDEDD